jgi:hypothetical protein
MRNVFTLALTTSLAFLTARVFAGSPLSSVQVTLRGKKYEVGDVTTVEELQERLRDASGVDPSAQGRVLFDGQRLSPSDTLTDVGVKEGAQLNIVPASASSKKKKSSSSGSKNPVKAASTAATATTTSDNPMKEMMEKAGIDSSQLDDLVKSMGGGGEGGEAPSMQESMQMMSTMMNSPVFQEYMNDPDKLEESRQMILTNPMLKSMMAGMPGMEELLNNKDAWREAMQAAAGLYSSMDSKDLMQAMMGSADAAGAAAGMGGAGGMPSGLFDGMDMNMNSAASSLALDELSEGEDE